MPLSITVSVSPHRFLSRQLPFYLNISFNKYACMHMWVCIHLHTPYNPINSSPSSRAYCGSRGRHVNRNVLRLTDLCLDHDHPNSSAQYSFASSILPGVCASIVDKGIRHVFIQLTLLDGVVYRIGFALPEFKVHSAPYVHILLSFPPFQRLCYLASPISSSFFPYLQIHPTIDSCLSLFTCPLPFAHAGFPTDVSPIATTFCGQAAVLATRDGSITAFVLPDPMTGGTQTMERDKKESTRQGKHKFQSQWNICALFSGDFLWSHKIKHTRGQNSHHHYPPPKSGIASLRLLQIVSLAQLLFLNTPSPF